VSLAEAIEAEAPLRRFKPYPAYKDSGIEWLGKIPAHWEALNLKRVSRFAYGDALAADARQDADVEVYGSNGPVGCHDRANTLSPCLIIGRKGSFGKVNFSDQPVFAIDTTFFVDGRLTRADMRWLYYVLVNAQLDAATKDSAIPGLDREDAYAKDVCLCAFAEQRAIAALLDRETARIDALIAKKEELIALLQEKRTALITRAVTKGLDPNASMKNSGVEWLGEIPAHWDCLALARVTLSRCDGPFGSSLKSEHYSDDGVRVVRLQNIGWAEFIDSDRAYIDEAYSDELGDHDVITGDLLIAGLGDEAHPVGRACVAPSNIEPAMVKADCFRFRLNQRRLIPRFAAYQLSAMAAAAAGSMSTGATRSRMNLTITGARKVAVPPLGEQHAIVRLLDRDGQEFRAIVTRVRDAIDRLKELRTALISAAVTGKIDVREEVT
jgi:type I restriction enzyme, S subunit